MAREESPRRRRGKRLATRVHRWLGIGSFAVVLVISLTGILLNHTVELGLNERYVTSSVVLRHYDLQPEGEPAVFRDGDNLLAVWGGELILDGLVVDSVPPGENPAGAGKISPETFAFVFPSLVVISDSGGIPLDRIEVAGKIRRAGTLDGSLVVETESGELERLQGGIEFVPAETPPSHWFAPAQATETAEREILLSALRGEGLPLSRIVIDLHSGRLFGLAGVVVYDLAAVALVVLGITGIQLWFRRRKRTE